MNFSLCHYFQGEAIATWLKIAAAHRVGFAYGEETITENILLNLHLRHADKIKIWPYDKWMKEPDTGADWEWWIGHTGEWFGMRVQAKKISLPLEDYGSILTYKTKSKTKSQIRILIEQAELYGVTPIYCLYTYSSSTPSPLPNCIPSLSRKKVNGCLIGHAEKITQIGSNKLIDLAPNLVPWHFLVCECSGSGSHYGAAFRAQNAVLESLDTEPPETPEEWEYRSSVEPGEDGPFVSQVVQSLPPELMDFLGATGSLDFMSSYAEKRDLAGVVVLTA